ncbi:uncharacterized protein LOC128595711 isoform X5 [Nycticebus coucang]|uniref:uncharacterized protein LOC128595711 isoform X5 n=1 Tax=Nycticebus coucang TaxID=9470 RepID=UPI00234D625E|nr:uncharacterized protein LOC128595711 isoform X5 [Nycticebus coucang]
MDRQMLRHRSCSLHSTGGEELGRGSPAAGPPGRSLLTEGWSWASKKKQLHLFWCHLGNPSEKRRSFCILLCLEVLPEVCIFKLAWGRWVHHHPPTLFLPRGLHSHIQHHGQLQATRKKNLLYLPVLRRLSGLTEGEAKL